MTVIGFDLYNQCLSGYVAHTISSSRADNEHIPCVLIWNMEQNDDIPKSNGESNGKHASRKLLRTGCIQRYVRSGE